MTAAAAVVPVHGALLTADDMRLGPMPGLTRSLRCVAFDRPGQGWSDHRRGADGSLWGQMETLRGGVRALGLERPVICGHSLGGAVALACAMAHPDEIAGAVAGATLDPALLRALCRAMFLPQAMPPAFAASFPFARAAHPGQTVAAGENAMALWPDLARSAFGYAGCRAPVRILCGTADIAVNGFTQGAPAAVLIPTARIGWLAGSGHTLHHARPEAVIDAVASLLDGSEGEVRPPRTRRPTGTTRPVRGRRGPAAG